MNRTRMRPVVAPALVFSCVALLGAAACFPDPTSEDGLPSFDAGGLHLDGSAFDAGSGVDGSVKCALTLCNLVCVDIGTDLHNCGACGHDCTKLPGVVASDVTCIGGVCDLANACAPGKRNCSGDLDAGCDTDITTASHCGSCTTSCSEPTPFCSEELVDGGVEEIDAGDAGPGNGIYTCASGCGGATPTRCDSECVDTTTDVDHCGSCNACPSVTNATRTCITSSCGYACDTGYTDTGTACLPTIDITAPVPNATDGGGTTATFHVSRGSASAGDLVVSLTVDASSTVTTTATGSIPVDYSLSGGSVSQTGTSITVTIPDGQTGVDVTMTPTANTHAEAAETLVLDVASDASYLVGTSTATATIAAHGLGVIVTTDSASSYALLEGSIRQAITNAQAFAGGTITVSVSGTVSLVGSLPLVDQNVSITGPSPSLLTLAGDGTFTIIEMRGTGTWSYLAFDDGFNSTLAGAMYVRGNLTLDHVTFDGNSAPDGAAIFEFAVTPPTLTLTNCTVTNNGSGVAIDNRNGTLSIGTSTFSGNAGGNVAGTYTNAGGNSPANP